MVKIYLNVIPRNLNEEIEKENLQLLIESGYIKVPDGYNCEYEYDCQLYQQAINLRCFLDEHGVNVSVGLTCAPNDMYPGWQLLVDTENTKDSFNAIVSRFFSWAGIENQHIIDFEELVKDNWD